MITEDIQNRIDDYLLNNMSKEDKIEFKTLIDEDPALREIVDAQQLILEEMVYRKEFNRIVQEDFKKNAKVTPLFKWSTSIAASVIGVIIIMNVFTNNKLNAIYNNSYTSIEREVYRGEAHEDEKSFFDAIELLDQKEYKEAKIIFLELYQLSEEYPYYYSLRWHLALTEVRLHNKRSAVKYLKELLDSEFYNNRAEELLDKL